VLLVGQENVSGTIPEGVFRSFFRDKASIILKWGSSGE